MIRIQVSLAAFTILLLAFVGAPRLRASKDGRSVGDANLRIPVLVELFTSEGCSSCPPADALLERLDHSQPVRDADIVVLSEHVDYWNSEGWKDPYSSHEYSERQSAYASQLGLRTVYTPQMIVDGHTEFVGSDERRAIRAIETSRNMATASVSLSAIRLDGNNTVSFHLDVGTLPSLADVKTCDVLIAAADDSDVSRVSRGENSGRTLTHVAVLRSLTRVGTVSKGSTFSQDVRIRVDDHSSGDLRLIAIVQEAGAGKVWGVGSGRLAGHLQF